MCVWLAFLPSTARRGGLATGGAALALLWSMLWMLAAAPTSAGVRGDDWRLGGAGSEGGSPGWERWGGSRASDPLAWLRHSRNSFQTVMRKLARRSAGRAPPSVRPGIPPEPDKARPSPSRRPPEWPEPRIAEPDRTRVKEWRRSWSPDCRRAGVPVDGAGWYVVAAGDTLWRIAWVHYGNSRGWRRILSANAEAIFDPDLIYACQRLFIPRWHPDRAPCGEPDAPISRRICDRPPPRLDRGGPGGCSRCGAGANGRAWGWR